MAQMMSTNRSKAMCVFDKLALAKPVFYGLNAG